MPIMQSRAAKLGRSVAVKVRGAFSPYIPRRRLTSRVCTHAYLNGPVCRYWTAQMREQYQCHRKLWEWGFIAQALAERKMLQPGRRGLGFAVGSEPLASLFAARGCEVVATDLDPAAAAGDQTRWMDTGQHAASLALLNGRGICPPAAFAERVTLRYVDMRDVPADLSGFDFVWSSCSFEHLGSLEHGQKFIERMCDCLRPGGVAVHTTEFNVTSDDSTVAEGPDVFFRRRDIEEMAERVAAKGVRLLPRDYSPGTAPEDEYVDQVPFYNRGVHLKLEYLGHVITSIGLIFEKRG
jgi:SAM-dependent methyltransferase